MAVNEHASVETRCFMKTKQTAYFVILVNLLLEMPHCSMVNIIMEKINFDQIVTMSFYNVYSLYKSSQHGHIGN